MTDSVVQQAVGPLTLRFDGFERSSEERAAIAEAWQNGLASVCSFLDVSESSVSPITIHVVDALDREPNTSNPASQTFTDLDAREVWTAISSESAGACPAFELTHLVLRDQGGASPPEARFWEDGLAGHLARICGLPYFAEAADRAERMRQEGQLRPLVNVIRQYRDHSSASSVTTAAAFVRFLIESRGADRFKRALSGIRGGTVEEPFRTYRRSIPQLDTLWQRQMEKAATAGGGKMGAAVKGTLPFFKPYRWSLAALVVMVFLGLVFDVTFPLALRFLIDSILGSRPITFDIPFVSLDAQRRIIASERLEALGVLLVVLVGLFGINTFARIQQAALTSRVGQGVIYDLRMRYLTHIQHLPLAILSRTSSTDLMQRFQVDIPYVAAAFSAGLVPMFSNGVAMVLFGLTMLAQNWTLSIVAFLGLPVFAYVTRLGRAAVRTNTRETVRRNQEIQQSVLENFGIQVVLKVWNQARIAMERLRERLDINRETNINNAMIMSQSGRASVLITNAFTLAVLAVGGWMVIESEGRDLTAGALMAFYLLMQRMYQPAGLFAAASQSLTLSADSLTKLNSIMNREPDTDSPSARQLGPLQQSLHFDHVTFALTRGKNVLSNVEFEITRGQRVGVVGPTGAGKQALVQLLPRLYDVTSGAIRWDGQPLTDFTRESVRDQVIVLPNDTSILNLTIYDNILVGRPMATQAEVVEAARAVGLHEFIVGLPGGYDTIVSDRDTAISTPDRQRLAAARALLRKDASLVVMEDAFSALEASQQRDIERLLRGPNGDRTVIKVTQRVSAVEDADLIIVMDGGEVVGQGTHGQLEDDGGTYAQLRRDELGEAATSGARQAVRRLGRLQLFESVPEDKRSDVLEETARLLLYAERAPGEVICRQGSSGDELFFIGRGDVEIVVDDGEGNETNVAVLGEGDFFGEISFLRRTPRTATVRAQTNVELHILRRLDFDQLLDRLGAGTLAHLEATAQARLRDTEQKLATSSSGA
jgi:ABC-type multidrug transport system fused ATPase/permease subunit